MAKAMTKAQVRQRLMDNAIERTKWLGATGGGNDVYNKLTLDTQHGKLSIFFDPDDSRQIEKIYGPTISVFCQFDKPEAIKAFGLEGNHYSGKWNWHCLDKDGVDAFIAALGRLVMPS